MATTRVLQQSFNGGEVTPEFFGRIDDVKRQHGLATMRNFVALPQGPAIKRPGFVFVHEAGDSAARVRLIPFVYSVTQAFAIEMGDGYIRFHANGGTLLAPAAAAWSIVTPYSVGDFAAKSGKKFQCLIAHTGWDPEIYDNFWYELPATGEYQIKSQFAADDVFGIHYAQSNDVLTLVHPDYAPRELRRNGAYDWRLTQISFVPSLDAPSSVAATNTVGAGATTYGYKATAVGDNGLDESLASSPSTCTNDLLTTGNYNTVSWAAVTGARRYNVYREDNGLYGYIGQTDGLSFRDDNITADISRTPPESYNPFSGAGDYPGAVSYFEQRRLFAGTTNKPQNVWMTRTGTESNMSYSLPTRDDDSINIRIASRENNSIRHIVPLGDIVLLTNSGEWRVTSVNSDAITPTTVSVKPQSYVGASNVQPLLINTNLVYAEGRGGHVRELAYNWQASGYVTGDLSIRSPHLFDLVTGSPPFFSSEAMALIASGGMAAYSSSTRRLVARAAAPSGSATVIGNARREGLPIGQATAYAGVQSGLEGAFELAPFMRFAGDLKASSPLLKIMLGQASTDLPGELATNALQDMNEWLNLHPEKTFQDYLDERPNAALQTAVASIVGSAVMTGPGVIMARAAYKKSEEADKAEARAKILEQINQAAAASKVLARDADTFQDFVRQAADGGPVTDVYIDADVLNQSGLADQVIAASPAAAAQYQEALATGGQVRIPIDEYAARIAPQEYAQQLLDDLRLQPEDMTRREAQTYAQSGAMQELEAAMASIIGDKAQSDTFTASRDAVRQRVLDNLNALGRFTPQKNELDATLIAARSATRAAQLGITPEQFFDQYVLNVVAEGAGGQVLNQFAGQGALTADLGALKAAQDRVAAGEDAETVRRETGWHTGTDGKWRFEISDADARLTPAIKSLDRGGYDAADMQEVTYRKNDDGTYSVALMHEGAKDSSGFVNLDSVPEEVVRAILPDDVFAAVRRGDGEADFIGANLDDAKLIKSPFKFEGMNALPLDMVIDHPALFAEYPDLRRAFVRVDPKAGIGGSMAEMDNGTLVITVGSGQKQSTMLHEIQHAIQNYEGFATGGSHADAFADPRMRPGATKKTLAAANRLLAEKLADLRQPDSIERFARMAWNTDEITPALEASYADYVKTVGEAAVTPNIQRAAQEWASKEWYRRLAGEVEARNVQARMHMTAQERRAKLPRTTADVAEGDQIVRHTNSTNELRRTGGR